MNESEKQFSFTRAALSTGGRAKSKFLSVFCCPNPSNPGDSRSTGLTSGKHHPPSTHASFQAAH
jgi:hypothetical protein